MQRATLAVAICLLGSGPAPATPMNAPRHAHLDEWKEARRVAEGETGGKAVQTRRIDLNGSSGGYEVMIRMEGREKGWRLIIDRDTWRVRHKYAVPNP